MFAPSNVNVGRDASRSTNLRRCEDLVSKDVWTKLSSLTNLELGLDNLVGANAWFWPRDRSMVTKTKCFKAILNQETRIKLLEMFINQVQILEVY